MNRITTTTVICILLLLTTALADDPPYGGLKLLDGYRYKRSRTTDTINGVIYKDGGLSIEFESGISEGYAADPRQKAKYVWYREQIINEHKIFLALGEGGAATKWKPERPRSATLGRVLMVTFPGKFGPNDAANFYAEVLDEKEIAETLLMVLTFDPTQ
jgi:hypothetical protein